MISQFWAFKIFRNLDFLVFLHELTYSLHKSCKLWDNVDFFSSNTSTGSVKNLKTIGNLSLLAKILKGLTLPLLKTPFLVEKPRKLFTTRDEKRRI